MFLFSEKKVWGQNMNNKCLIENFFFLLLLERRIVKSACDQLSPIAGKWHIVTGDIVVIACFMFLFTEIECPMSSCSLDI